MLVGGPLRLWRHPRALLRSDNFAQRNSGGHPPSIRLTLPSNRLWDLLPLSNVRSRAWNVGRPFTGFPSVASVLCSLSNPPILGIRWVMSLGEKLLSDPTPSVIPSLLLAASFPSAVGMAKPRLTVVLVTIVLKPRPPMEIVRCLLSGDALRAPLALLIMSTPSGSLILVARLLAPGIHDTPTCL